MLKSVLGIATLATALVATSSNASTIVTSQSITPDAPTASYVSLVNGQCSSPCSFQNTITFVTPTGQGFVIASYNTTASTEGRAVLQQTNLDFVTGTFNNGTTTFDFTIGATGIVENGSALFIPLFEGATNTIVFKGAANAGDAGTVNANIQGGLSFSAATPPVPEPSTWALMLVGFGAVGHGLRRRKLSAAIA